MEFLQNLIPETMLPDMMFYVFAGLTLGFGILVVANPFSRNPVTSAMFLVLAVISMAGLFVLLHAFFLAAVQVIVYAGAVMVLFLFVIMLLDIKDEQKRKIKKRIPPGRTPLGRNHRRPFPQGTARHPPRRPSLSHHRRRYRAAGQAPLRPVRPAV